MRIGRGETGYARLPEDAVQSFSFDTLHERFHGCGMANDGCSLDDAEQAVVSGMADLL